MTLEVCSPRPSLIHCELTNLSSNGDLNFNTGFDVDDDLLDGLGGGEEAERAVSDKLQHALKSG